MFNFDSELFKLPRWAGVRVALVFCLIVICLVAATVCWGIGMGIWSAAPTNSVASLVCLGLAWGCFLLKRWAFWVSAVLTGLYGLTGLIFLPGALIPTLQTASSMSPSRHPEDAYMLGFLYVTYMIAILSIIAFVLLISRRSREAFGIGKFGKAQ